jgi:type I restriction enzyme S subunit
VTGRYGTVGEVFFIREDFWPLNTTLFVSDFKGNDPLFISFMLRTIDFESHSGKSGVPGVNRNDLHGLDVVIPPLSEQRAIAAALSDVDALISALDRLIAKKRAAKTAAMQQLLTGKQRLPGFSGEWSNVELGELGTFSKGRGIRKDEVVSNGVPCVRYGEIYTLHHDHIRKFHSFIPESVAHDSQRIKRGDLLFTGSGETIEEIGKCVAYLDNQEAYAGGDIVVFSPMNADSMFLGYLMNHSSVMAQKSRMGQGDAVVHISSNNLARLRFALPPKVEQTAIADVLSAMDAEIEALEARREKTRQVKQGMMQELLTGRTRLV